jgi:hypothetical protein
VGTKVVVRGGHNARSIVRKLPRWLKISSTRPCGGRGATVALGEGGQTFKGVLVAGKNKEKTGRPLDMWAGG